MQPARIPLSIIQGATLRIMQPRFEYRAITAIASTAPVRLTCAHDLPGDWLAWIQGVQHLPELNRTPRRPMPRQADGVAGVDQ